MKRLVVPAAIAWIGLLATPARAWNADSHEAIAQAAFLISPEAAARVPAGQQQAFLREIREPDPFDRRCERHCGPQARVDAATEAEKAFHDLTAPGAATHPYDRARLLARYLHYAADCAVPAAVLEGKTSAIPDFFANKNFAVFREPRPLTLPLAAALRKARTRAAWADDTPGAYSSLFRQAVNVTIDALFALPGPPEGGPAADPVLLVINRLDSGTSTSWSTPFSYDRQITIEGQQAVVRTQGELREGGEGVFTPDILKVPGLHVVEWAFRTNGAAESVVALLYNHQDYCASNIVLRAGKWTSAVAGEIPPEQFCLVSLDAPPGVALPEVRASWASVRCTGGKRDGLVDARKGLVVEGGGISAPRFDAARPLEPAGKPPRVLSR